MIYISQSTIPSQTANSIQVMRMCEAFVQNGCQVELVVPWYPHKLLTQPSAYFDIRKYYGVRESFHVRFLPGPLARIGNIHLDGFSWQAIWYAQLRKPSLVYTRSLTLAAKLVSRGQSTAVECHEYDLFVARGDLFALTQVAHSPYLRSIIVISSSLKQLYVKYGLPEEKLLVAHDGVDERFLQTTTVNTVKPPLPVTIPKDKPLVCYAGKLAADRGVNLLLRAAQALPDMHFLLLGGRKEELRFWQDQIDAMNIRNVTLTGFVPPTQVASYLPVADVLVAPYTTHISTINAASPLKIFEYLAAGVPAVISDLPTIREVVVDGYDAILVPPDSVTGLIDGILRALRPESRQIGQNARQTASRYTWQARAKQILNKIGYWNDKTDSSSRH